jgi:predicted RNA-binding Zn ribbon-like protein
MISIMLGEPMGERLPPPVLIADSPALDFLNSLSIPTDKEIDWIGSGEDLIAWLQTSGMVARSAIATLRDRAVPGELDNVAAEARKMREWFRGFVEAHKGTSLMPKALQELEPLNRILLRDEEFGQVVIREPSKSPENEPPFSGLAWSRHRKWRSPDALLFPIAKAIADLVCDDDLTDVKACEGHNCTLLFVDRTRGHARRWCSMSVCGNRAKQAAHRERTSRLRE